MSTKRKAALAATNAATDAPETPAVKKRKVTHSGGESSETTSQTGFDLLAQLRRSRDKQGWQIATHFEKLPDPKVIPEYYEEIALPIALETLEQKLERREYPTISIFESDIKRMISNAKSYNQKSSQIYSDAEKVRKLVSNFMVDRNPAYKSQNYQAVATPIPENWVPPSAQKVAQRRPIKEESQPEQSGSDLRRARRPSRNAAQTPSEQDSRHDSSTPAAQDLDEDVGESFEGNTFQQAQAKIVRELMELTDDDNRLVSANFIHLPPRSLLDYYRIIKHPVSLKGLQKLVRGMKGHGLPTDATLLRSWNAFEEEASYIWKNAREYNEDESEIVQMAEMLEEYFFTRLAEAKDAVAEPPQPRVKLRMGGKSPEAPPKITLKFGHPKPSPSSGISVDNEALKRQQELVKAGISRGKSPSEPRHTALAKPPVVGAAANGIIMNGVKRESTHAPSPAPTAGQMNGITSQAMAPPSNLNAQTPSESPQLPPVAGVVAPPVFSSSNFHSQWRQPGKNASDALILSVNISSHSVSNAQRFNFDVPASDRRTHQSFTIALPSIFSPFRIAPQLSPSLMQRPSKTIVSCNSMRLQPIAQRDLSQIRPIYEYTLAPGINVIEIEVIAGLPRGTPKIGSGSETEVEKLTVFANM